MKKLMVMAAVMCLGFAAQATTYVSFYCPDMVEQALYTPESTPMQGYISLFAKESNTANDYAQVGPTIYMDEDGCVSAEGWVVNADLDKSKTYDFYYVIDGAGYNDWVYTSGGGANTSFDYGYGEFDPEYTTGSWSQVPEPTSGALLLLGLAGLALKRKRA